MKLISVREDRQGTHVILTFADGSTLKTTGAVLTEAGVFAGDELSDEQLRSLRALAGRASARERAVRIVAASGVSERELRRRLEQRGERSSDAGEAVDWLRELHLIDDRETALQLTAGAVRKGYGRSRIRAILREKGIPQEYWEEALSEVPQMDDAIDRFLHRCLDGKPLDDKLIRRTADALLRRGHGWPEIRAGLKRYREDLELADTMEEPE